ncbi:D-alanyl-D-alanine carboxypeptidase family protein [Bacillus sp. V3B]|nr:D-alanyl-D-alanine carboxypeptidase family protein [Bacillus sp. V3B]MCQ6276614.1 D-alanyl-D-alanine carboxypeptidase family protein [Bacillus sp. V3B]
MKKLIIAIGSVALLSGCNLDTLRTQIPFSQKSTGSVQQDEQSPIDEQVEEQQEEKVVDSKGKENNDRETESKITEDQMSLEAAFFNDIVQVDGKNIIQNPTNRMVLVNKEFALPDGYRADDLVRPNVRFSFGDEEDDKSLLRIEAADALEEMFEEAETNGLYLFAVSGYRSYERQKMIFDAQVNQVGYEKAALLVAFPGNSEHQTGLSMDISSESNHFGLTEKFGETAEGKWLMENAHRFGFILRYPSGKEEITGYDYEPWHYRYVGEKEATEIYEKDLTLEEFFHIVEKI